MGFTREFDYAARSLRSTPLFAITTVAMLALGIGATSAVFSVVNGLLLQPLPVREPDRLVRIWKNNVRRGFEHEPLSYPEYEHWAERATRFESFAALSGHGGPMKAFGASMVKPGGSTSRECRQISSMCSASSRSTAGALLRRMTIEPRYRPSC